MPRVLLTGTYSSFNRGDAAMQSCMIAELRTALPGVEVVLHAPFPDADRRYYDGVRVVGSSRRRLIRATLKLGWVAFRRWVAPFPPGRSKQPADAELRQIAGSDLVIDLSGDMLTEEHGLHLTYSHFLPLLMALWLGRPLFICAQSIGPFRLSMPLARYVLRRASAITAREPVTMEYLRTSGAAGMRRVEQTADLAFLLRPASAQRVDEILRAEGISTDAAFLGISVSAVVATTYARHHPGADRLPFADMLADALDTVQERFGMPVVFISHVIGPKASKDDRRISREVRQRMKRAAYAQVMQGDYRAEEVKGVIGRAHAFCGARMHANIAALSSAVPTLAISYSHKTMGIMQSLGMSEWVADSRTLSADDLVRRLTALWEQRRDLSARIQDALDLTMTAARRNVAIALHLLETPLADG